VDEEENKETRGTKREKMKKQDNWSIQNYIQAGERRTFPRSRIGEREGHNETPECQLTNRRKLTGES
jgi:hypothetical protein